MRHVKVPNIYKHKTSAHAANDFDCIISRFKKIIVTKNFGIEKKNVKYEYYVYLQLLVINLNKDEDITMSDYELNLQNQVHRAKRAVKRPKISHSYILKHKYFIVRSERSGTLAAASELMITLLINHIYIE